MPDILVVKSTAFLSHEKMQAILDNLKAQKETGVILLPSYLEAQIVPDDIEFKLTGPNDSEKDTTIITEVRRNKFSHNLLLS